MHATDRDIGGQIKSWEPQAKVQTHHLDITSPSSIAAFKAALGDQPVSLLLRVAGIMAGPKRDSLSTTSLKVL